MNESKRIVIPTIFVSMKIFISTILIIGVLGCFFIGILQLKRNSVVEKNRKELLEKGVVTKASFVRKKDKVTKRLNQQINRYQSFYSYYITYRFDVKSHSKGALSFTKALKGEKQDLDLSTDYREFSIGVNEETYRKVSYGSTKKVMYLKENPEIYEVLSTDEKFYPNYKLYYGIGLLAFGLLCVKLFHQYITTGKTW